MELNMNEAILSKLESELRSVIRIFEVSDVIHAEAFQERQDDGTVVLFELVSSINTR